MSFDITGMSCSSCSSKIEREMNLVEGVIKVSVNLMTKQMKIDVTKGKGPGPRDIVASRH